MSKPKPEKPAKPVLVRLPPDLYVQVKIRMDSEVDKPSLPKMLLRLVLRGLSVR